MSCSTSWHSVSLPGELLSTVCISAVCRLSIALLKSPETVSVMSWCSASIPASGQLSSGGIFHTGLRWDGGSGQKMEELRSNSHRDNACDDVICHIHRPEKKEDEKKKGKPNSSTTALVFSDRRDRRTSLLKLRGGHFK